MGAALSTMVDKTDDDEQPERQPVPRAWREEFDGIKAHPADRVQEAGTEGTAQGSAAPSS
jgi:hypothetical protein